MGPSRNLDLLWRIGELSPRLIYALAIHGELVVSLQVPDPESRPPTRKPRAATR